MLTKDLMLVDPEDEVPITALLQVMKNLLNMMNFALKMTDFCCR